MAPPRALASALLAMAALLWSGPAEAARTGSRSGARLTVNPIRRVVTMLQSMQKKVTEEGERDQEQFEKFRCLCKNGAGDLEKSVARAEAKVPMLESSLSEGEAKKAQLKKDIAQHRQDREEAKQALAKGSAIREREAAAFSKESSDAKANIAALAKAIAALEKGVYGFLQTSAGATLRRLAIDVDMSMADRDQLSSFLSRGGDDSSSPAIIGILKQMKETMEKGLAEATSSEEAAKTGYEAMAAAKEKELAASTKGIEAKLEREGQLGVEVEATKEDLDDTSKALAQDKQFLADLDGNCEAKEKEHKAVQQARTQELLVIGDTIDILNNDTSLDLFKKALPSPSLLQLGESGKAVRQEALEALRTARRGRHAVKDARLDLVALALRARKASFEKIVRMVDDMLALLAREQKDDDDKKVYCTEEIDKSEDELKQLGGAAADLEKVAEDIKGKVETLAEEIQALGDGIVALDKQVAEAGEARKAEHRLYSEDLASNGAAKDILEAAGRRLLNFYLARAPAPAAQLLELGFGDASEMQAPSFSQLSSRATARRAGAVMPSLLESAAPYSKKGQEANGVLEMLRMLSADISKEMTEMEVAEKDAQADYEQLVTDSAAKRAADAKSLSEKEGAKAGLEAELQKVGLDGKSKTKEAAAMTEVLRNLHGECDWLLANFQVRAEARAGEADALKSAKAVLSGADYSLVQTERRSARAHRA